MLAAIRRGGDAPASPEEAVFEAVADEVFTRYARNWKPGTLKVNRNYYRNHILPRFKGRPIAGIDSRDVRQWFASLHAKPAAADRSAPILSVIMRQAEIYGYRPEGSNPCKGIKRYRREGRERFLSAAEIRSLAAVLDRFEADRPQQVAIIRLLLLTGCRASEVRTLKWRYRREGKLFLPDSKTGPRTVWLSSAARAVLDRVPRTASWMFPSGEVRRLRWRDVKRDRIVLHESKTGPRHVLLSEAARELLEHSSKSRSAEWVFPGATSGRPLGESTLYLFWRRVRDEGGIVADARLHDLRHSHASHAIMNGESLHMTGRLLGHRRAATTNRYAHLDDVTLSAAAECLAGAIDRKLSFVSESDGR